MNKKSVFTILLTISAIFISSIILFSKPVEKTANLNSKGSIIVEMTNFANNDGFVLVGLYNDAKGFPGTAESMIMSARSEIKDKKATVIFKDVPYGVYAVSGYHDENKNGKLDTGMFGIPKEGLITSNNAVGNIGPVKFEDAKFELRTPSLKMELKVKYY